MRDHALFRSHPDREVALDWGPSYRLPFHCYDAEALVVGCTVDADPLADLLAPDDLHPYILVGPSGRRRGAAWLWFNDYRDTNAGTYRELVIGFGASEQPREVPWRHAASTFAPLVDPAGTIFARWLFLDRQYAVDLGIDVWGYPKQLAEVRMAHEGGRLACSVVDAGGRAVLDLKAHPGGVLSTLSQGPGVARALGVGRALDLVRPPVPVHVTTPADVKRSHIDGLMAGSPRIAPWRHSDRLEIHVGSPCGAALTRLGLAPHIAQHYDHLRFVMPADPASLQVEPHPYEAATG